MARILISENTIRELVSTGKKSVSVPPDAMITPHAQDLADSHGIKILREELRPVSAKAPDTQSDAGGGKEFEEKVVAFGSDHGGYQLKELLKKYAEGMGYTALDVGTLDEQPCDYPDFAYAVARAVAEGKAWRGVMIDGAGIGSCVVANKVPGVKAACCHNEFVARNAREHNDTNVLTLGSRVVGSEVCKEILRVWLETWFAGGRHKARVDKIDQVEHRFLKP